MQVQILMLVHQAVADGKGPEAANEMADEVLRLADDACYDLDIPIPRPEPPEEVPPEPKRRPWRPADPGDVFQPVEKALDLDGL